MTLDVAALIQAGLQLDLDERVVLANALVQSLHDEDRDDTEQAEIDAAWSEEISSRVDDVLEGKVQLVDADEHYAQLRAKVAARRK